MGVTLVTGGAGAIGAHLVAALIAEGERVVVLDDLSAGFEENLPGNADLIRGSILDATALEKALSPQVRLVFHLAASFANQASIEHPEADLQVNGLGTLRVAQRALDVLTKGTAARVVYSSTSCVYGAHPEPIREDAPLRPMTPYAASKLIGEHYLRYFARTTGLPIVILRLFNSYGPGDYPGPHRGVIPRFTRCAVRNEPLTVTGTGAETRDFTYVTDIVDALLRAAREPAAAGRTYNIGTGVATRIDRLASLIIQLSDSGSGITFDRRRTWDAILTRRADNSAAVSELGFSPRTALSDGLIRSIAWMRMCDASPAWANM